MVKMLSKLWDVPGIQSSQSLDFLERVLNPICIYDVRGRSLYASQRFLRLFQVDSEPIDFFTYFQFGSIELATLSNYWQRALQGENVWFLSRVRSSQENLECSLQYDSEAALMFLSAQRFEPVACSHVDHRVPRRSFMRMAE